MRVARRVVASGHVQGVFFRASARDLARDVGVDGWVRNRADGTVELWLEGDEDAVARVVDWVRGGGPPAARVDDVRVEEHEPERLDGFTVRR